MSKNIKRPVKLTKRDRAVLSKYTKFYTNFIESNTAQSNILEQETYKPGR
ncbi:MAG TPA: hypothetical protein GXX14_04990 [Clostridiaceae bacterium]|nr:hypothetical protein [Clostridiaceae bacterium]